LGISLIKEPAQQFVILYDASSIQFKNFDLDIVKKFMKISSYYPDRLKKMYIMKPNWAFKMLLGLTKVMVESETTEKLHTIYEFDELFEFIDRDQVQKEYGGDSDFVYDHVEYLKKHNYSL
jgi:hypothetical protein